MSDNQENTSAPETLLYKYRHLLVTACLLLFVLLSTLGMWNKSNTWDEISHFGSGYMAVFGDSVIPAHHPMFSKTVAVLPLLFYRDRLLRPESLESFHKNPDKRIAAYDLLYHNTVDAKTILRLTRMPGILWGLLLGWIIYLFARDLYGWRAGMLALFLFALSPNLIAHAGLVTLDFPVAVLMTAATYFFYRCCTGFAWKWLTLCALCAGLAMATKISACILVPVFLLMLALQVLTLPRLELPCRGRFTRIDEFLNRKSILLRKLAVLGVVGLTAMLLTWFAVWAAYGFRYDPIADSSGIGTLSLGETDPPGMIFAFTRIAWNRRLLPQHFLLSLRGVARHIRQGHPSYLRGQISSTGWWYYFPYVMAVKTPAPTLIFILFALAGSIFFRKHLACGLWRRELLLLTPAAVFMGVSMAGNINIGIRHILPVYTLLFVFAGKTCLLMRLIRNSEQRLSRLTRLLPALLCCWLALETMLIHPHYLAYFNVFAGGPRNGHRHLVDSNLDWGQDLPELKKEMDRLGIDEIKLSYFGTASPDYYGINYIALPSYTIIRPSRIAENEDFTGWYAVSATMLNGVFLAEAPEFARFMRILRDNVEPVSHAGYSIFIYRLDGL